MLRFVILCTVTNVILSTAHPHSSVSVIPQLDGRIVGGEPANIFDFPYQLSFEYFNSHFCGASIISPNIALTAAHCTDGISLSFASVRAGSSLREDGGQVVGVSQIQQHPKYSRASLEYDISILGLAKNLEFGAGIQPVALALDNEYIPDESVAVVTGWGKLKENDMSLPNQLQWVQVQIVRKSVCKNVYGPIITDSMICAGQPEGGKDSCQGDSGGPLVSGGKLVGIVSWGYGCAWPNYPGVYANVANLRKFIRDASGI